MDNETPQSASQPRGTDMEELYKEISAIRETLAGIAPVINETKPTERKINTSVLVYLGEE